ncbi:MAG: hypothetical protein ACRDPK_12595 [Carbonactinosporaceae bacterium]
MIKPLPCPFCGGTGRELHSVPLIDRPGSSKGIYRPCRECDGTGWIEVGR